MSEKLRIDLELHGNSIEQFKAVKKHLGVDRNTNVLRLLIAEKHRKIQKGAAI